MILDGFAIGFAKLTLDTGFVKIFILRRRNILTILTIQPMSVFLNPFLLFFHQAVVRAIRDVMQGVVPPQSGE
jgi:hypothetical protein